MAKKQAVRVEPVARLQTWPKPILSRDPKWRKEQAKRDAEAAEAAPPPVVAERPQGEQGPGQAPPPATPPVVAEAAHETTPAKAKKK